MKLEFIKYNLRTEVDGIRHINRYIVEAWYDEILEDERGEYAKLRTEIVEEIRATWDEIDKNGSIDDFVNKIKAKYNIE